jgi:transcriptional regulator with XRE-family HTH domain
VTALGPRLRELRHARGLTIRAVAEQVGVHFTTISKFEHGHEQPGEWTIRALAAVLIADAEGLLALAGKVPAELAQRAADDPQFALLLRRLPALPAETLKRLYEIAGIP